MMMLRFCLMVFLTTLAAPLAAQSPLSADEAFRLEVTREGDMLVATWEIAEGYYLYRDFMGAEDGSGAALRMALPDGEMKDDPNFGAVEIFHDGVQARIEGADGPVTLRWQGCEEDSICYPPQTRTIEAGADGGMSRPGAPQEASTQGFQGSGFTRAGDGASTGTGAGVGSRQTAEGGLVLAKTDGLIERFSTGGTLMVVAGFFGLGLLLSLTPCVFPMIPIVAGMVAGGSQRPSARRGALLGGAYVLGMAGAFALIGVAAAWSGQNLQIALQSPPAVILTAGLFVLLAVAAFGFFELQMPAVVSARLNRVEGRRGSLPGAMLLGVTSALIVGPCVTAPLAGALLYIAQSGDLLLGAVALFALGLGQGLPLVAVAAFGPQVLPRSGAWMERIRQLFGLAFLGLAVWMLGRILPGPVTLTLWSALLIGAGAALFPREAPAPLGAALAVILGFAGALQGVGAAMGADDPLKPLAPLAAREGAGAQADPFATVTGTDGLESALAASEGPALVYVTADWCTTCRSIERGPLSDPQVLAALEGVTPIKVDVSDFDDAAQRALDLLGAAGPPTMVFLDAARAEVPGTRIVGEVHDEALLAALREAAR